MKDSSAKDTNKATHYNAKSGSFSSVCQVHSRHVDEDSDSYDNDDIVASLNRARDQMKQGKFIPKEDVLEDA